MEDRIERQITIDASLDRVWELVTEPGWWAPTDQPVRIDRQPGAITVRDSSKWGQFPVAVVTMDPKTYAAFRWASQFPDEELTPGNSTLVEFYVSPTGEGVKVRVVESGFSILDASEAVREAGLESNAGGWTQELAALAGRAVQAA